MSSKVSISSMDIHADDSKCVEALRTRLQSVSRERLASWLERLARSSPQAAERIEYFTNTDKAAKALRRRIAAVGNGKKLIDYPASGEVALTLRSIAADIEADVLPNHPANALELAEKLIRLDEKIFARADDSDGVIAGELSDACGLWLRAAVAVRARGVNECGVNECGVNASGVNASGVNASGGANNGVPRTHAGHSASDLDWANCLYTLVERNDYGVRTRLLKDAGLLLTDPELRALAALFEHEALSSSKPAQDPAMAWTREAARSPEPTQGTKGSQNLQHSPRRREVPHSRGTRSKPAPLQGRDVLRLLRDGALEEPARGFQSASALALIAEALRDPILYERSIRLHSPQPNDLQASKIATHYLQYGDAPGALRWLQSAWEPRLELRRDELLVRAYEMLGNVTGQIEVRRRQYERSPTTRTFRALDALLPPADRASLRAQARANAGSLPNLIGAAEMLFVLNEPTLAGNLLADRSTELDGLRVDALTNLSAKARSHGEWLAATLILRALLNSVLERSLSKAYGHAARYLYELRAVADSIADFRGHPTHDQYEYSIRAHHERKSGFWSRVDGGCADGTTAARAALRGFDTR
jgi:hypothetical protein